MCVCACAILHPSCRISFYTCSTKRTNRPNQTSRPSPNRARAPHPLTPTCPTRYRPSTSHQPIPNPIPFSFPTTQLACGGGGDLRRRGGTASGTAATVSSGRRAGGSPTTSSSSPLLLLRHLARSQGGVGGSSGVSRLQWFAVWKVQPRRRWRVLADPPRAHTGEYLRTVLGFPPYLPVTNVLGFSPSLTGFCLAWLQHANYPRREVIRNRNHSEPPRMHTHTHSWLYTHPPVLPPTWICSYLLME
jgi:hypothetical protein